MESLVKSILVPFDNSEDSKGACKYAVDLASKYRSTVYVLGLVPVDYLEQGYHYESHTHISPLVQNKRLIREKVKEMKSLIFKNTNNGHKKVKIRRLVKRGKPLEEIFGVARDKHIDLIIMGKNTGTKWSHNLTKSFSQKVIRKSFCPVLTTKT